MIKKSVNINIGGEKREAKFTIGALEELEAMLPSHNVFSLMQKEQWSVTEIIACLYCSLKVYERGISRNKLDSWIADYCAEVENGMIDLRLRMLAALGICGLVVSDRGPFDEILTALEDEEEEAEGK